MKKQIFIACKTMIYLSKIWKIEYNGGCNISLTLLITSRVVLDRISFIGTSVFPSANGFSLFIMTSTQVLKDGTSPRKWLYINTQ